MKLFEVAYKLAEKYSIAKSSKPNVAKFKDGIVICGEFGSAEVEEIIDGEKFPLIVADPPYSSIVKETWDQGITSQHYLQWTEDCLKHLVKGGSLYIWGGIGKPRNRVFFEYLAKVEKETGMTMRDFITWSKKGLMAAVFHTYSQERNVPI